jgi:hypothetical protein
LMARGSSPGQRKVNRESYLVLVMDDT